MEGLGIGLFGLACGVVAGAGGASACWHKLMLHRNAQHEKELAFKKKEAGMWQNRWEKLNNKLAHIRDWCAEGHAVQQRNKKGQLARKVKVGTLLTAMLEGHGYDTL